MLPHADHRPTTSTKGSVDSAISFQVTFELRVPVRAISLGPSSVLWTAMPEAAVDEHRDTGAREDDVRSDPHRASSNLEVNPVPKAGRVECTTERVLRPSAVRRLPFLYPPTS
jgi:hypothetical protein